MTREQFLEPVIASVRGKLPISRTQILEWFADWDVLPFEVDGQHVWTMVAKGTEVHFALVQGWRPKLGMRNAVREFVRPVFDRHGFLTTRVRHGSPAQKKFVERIGFKRTWSDGSFEYFLLGTLPFERKTA